MKVILPSLIGVAIMGDDGKDDGEKFKGIINFLNNSGSNGVLLKKVLVWVDIQNSMTSSDLWILKANSKFLADEIMQAKAQFYQCAKDNGNEEITGKQAGAELCQAQFKLV